MKWLIFLTIFSAPLCSEVKEVLIRWDKTSCYEKCQKLLKKELEKAPGVEEIDLDSQKGEVILRWNPRIPFSYSNLDLIIRRMGIKTLSFYVKVRGTLHSQGKQVYLHSLGDSSKFLLLGKSIEKKGQYVSRNNLSSYPLSSLLLNKLKKSEKENRIVEIEGECFSPDRKSQRLIVDNLHIPK